MAEELINMDGIGVALTSIADKVGMTVAQMYEIYVRAQFMMAVAQIVFLIIWAIAIIIIIKKVYAWAYAENESNKYNDASDKFFKCFIGCLLTIIFVSLVIYGIYDASISIMCPEYTALKSLMSDIGDMIQLLK